MHTLNRHFRKIARPAFERHGFAYARVIGQWPAIVGDQLARWSRPERIRWRRRRGDGDATPAQGGELVVAVAAGRALDMHHKAPVIIERVNTFYGYAAIDRVKVRQVSAWPGSANPEPAAPPFSPAPASLDKIARIADPGLRRALYRLAGDRAHKRP